MRPRRARHSAWAGPTLRPKRAALTGVAGLRSGPAQADPQGTKQPQERKQRNFLDGCRSLLQDDKR
jgi:hypothetical protein